MVLIPDAQEKRIHDVHASHKPKPASASSAVAVAELPESGEPVEVAEAEEAVYEPVEEAVAEVEPEPAIAEASAPPGAEAPAQQPATSGAATAQAGAAPGAPPAAPARPKRRAGDPAKPMALIPTLDPRAGRLVKAAPRGGVPGVTTPVRPPAGARPRGPVDLASLNPALPAVQHAPGARRESHRRGSPGQEAYRTKHGKETFLLRKSRGRDPRPKPEPGANRPKSLEVIPPISVKKFSELSGLRAAEIIKTLFTNHKMLVTTNSMLDKDALEILGLEFDRSR